MWKRHRAGRTTLCGAAYRAARAVHGSPASARRFGRDGVALGYRRSLTRLDCYRPIAVSVACGRRPAFSGAVLVADLGCPAAAGRCEVVCRLVRPPWLLPCPFRPASWWRWPTSPGRRRPRRLWPGSHAGSWHRGAAWARMRPCSPPSWRAVSEAWRHEVDSQSGLDCTR